MTSKVSLIVAIVASILTGVLGLLAWDQQSKISQAFDGANEAESLSDPTKSRSRDNVWDQLSGNLYFLLGRNKRPTAWKKQGSSKRRYDALKAALATPNLMSRPEPING